MHFIKVDNDVLQLETNVFLAAIAQYREAFKADSATRMSKEFQMKAAAVDALVAEFAQSLKPVGSMSIITIINENIFEMFLRPKDETDFAVERGNKDYERFFDLAEKHYRHEPAKGFMGKEDAAKVAKQVLHDYLDFAFLFYKAIREQTGADVDTTLLNAFVERGHAFIDLPHTEERGKVFSLFPRQT
jgi:hypothetical protein